MNWSLILILVVITLAVSFTIFSLIKKYLPGVFKVRKLYLYALMAVLLLFPYIFQSISKYAVTQLVNMILLTVTFLIYFETYKIDKAQKNKPVVGRPKPKQNRIKNND